MKMDDENWWAAEAGEYVLGTLRNSERVLFERFMARDDDIQELVRFWEERLYPLNRLTAPIDPPAHLWNTIESHIDSLSVAQRPIHVAPPETETVVAPRALTPEEQRHIKPQVLLRTLTSLALAASLIAGVFLVYLLQNSATQPTSGYDRIATLTDQSGAGLWAVTADSQTNRVRVIAMAPPQTDRDSVHQLWQIKPDGAGVASVGLLSVEPGVIQNFLVEHPITASEAFAVSLEPAGGSPEPVPTGPVLFSGVITTLAEPI